VRKMLLIIIRKEMGRSNYDGSQENFCDEER